MKRWFLSTVDDLSRKETFRETLRERDKIRFRRDGEREMYPADLRETELGELSCPWAVGTSPRILGSVYFESDFFHIEDSTARLPPGYIAFAHSDINT